MIDPGLQSLPVFALWNNGRHTNDASALLCKEQQQQQTLQLHCVIAGNS
jgi:hypothetical protein